MHRKLRNNSGTLNDTENFIKYLIKLLCFVCGLIFIVVLLAVYQF